jgi:hypothetical protein
VIKGVLLDPGMLLSLEESGFEPRDAIISVSGDLGRILSMMAGCNVREEGELGAVYRGGEEHSESLVSIPYLAMVSSCTQLPVLRGESILL